MKETLAQFAQRIGRKLEIRYSGTIHECFAIIPMPDKERVNAYHLEDFYVAASVSGPALEFRARGTDNTVGFKYLMGGIKL